MLITLRKSIWIKKIGHIFFLVNYRYETDPNKLKRGSHNSFVAYAEILPIVMVQYFIITIGKISLSRRKNTDKIAFA